MSTEQHSEPGIEKRKHLPATKSRLFISLVAIVALLLTLGVFTVLQRRAQYQALAQETEEMAIPEVSVIHPIAEPPQEDLVLPSTLQAYVESPIYARTSGYLKKWYYDIGSRVQKGALLAEIDTPEVDQQLSQARADLATARANENLSEVTATRYQELIKTDGVSKQEVDDAVGNLAAKRAGVQSAEANVRRLEETESFKRIYAPFAGVVTRRNIDIGNLINAGNGGMAHELFYLAQTDPIRVYVNVPEVYVTAIHAGLPAYLQLQQYPGQKFQGKVVRTSDSIDQSTRTLLTEVDVPNHDGRLLPGGYAQVHLEVQVSGTHLQVPVNALLFRAEGLRAVTVDGGHRTHLQPIMIGRDYGTSLEVIQGLKASDWIVLNPPDSLDEGVQVNVKEIAPSAAANPPAATGVPRRPRSPGTPKSAGPAPPEN
jgi:RND family efflux transporter MFP subunit